MIKGREEGSKINAQSSNFWKRGQAEERNNALGTAIAFV